MNKYTYPLLIALTSATFAICPSAMATQTTTADFTPKNANASQKVSFAFGYEMVKQTPDLDISAFIAGIKTAAAKENSPFNQDELQQASQEINTANLKKLAEEADKNIKAGEAFLAENAKKPGVKVTASGLQYTVIQEGQGKQPKASNTVEVHYEGKLINGDIFDSSFEADTPIEFPLDQVIPGWTEGVQLMKEGSEYLFVIPAKLGYGAQGTGPIAPYSTLIFKIKLISIK